MYAIVEIAGFQELVEEGKTIRVPLHKEVAGAVITIGNVLMLVDGDAIKIGNPFVSGASIEGEVVSHGREDKIRVVKAHRRKRYRRVKGHRQGFTDMNVSKITVS